MFTLDPRLAADCPVVGRFPLSLLLLKDESRYPWFILVPQREGLRELHDLGESDRFRFFEESVLLSRAMEQALAPDKLNVAALGNRVAQLHLHHIARFARDAAWPDPVWGRLERIPYTDQARFELVQQITPLLGKGFVLEGRFG